MKVSKYLLATLTASFIISGCSEADEAQDNIDETSEETTEMPAAEEEESTEEAAEDVDADTALERTDDAALNAVIDRAEEIESYQAVLDLEATVDNAQPEALEADIRFKEGSDEGPPSVHLKSGGEDRTIAKDGETYYHNGTDWVDISDSVNVEQLYQATYNNAVSSFADIKGELESEEQGDTVVYRYEGDSAEVFNTFEQLFAVNFGTLDTDSVQNNVEIEVDIEEDVIRTIEYAAEGEDRDGSFELTGDVEFKSFNDVGEIEIPEGVR